MEYVERGVAMMTIVGWDDPSSTLPFSAPGQCRAAGHHSTVYNASTTTDAIISQQSAPQCAVENNHLLIPQPMQRYQI